MVGVFKHVFSMGFFSACYQRCFILLRFYSVMSRDEPISSGVRPEVQEAIKQAFSGLSANLTSVIESRLSDFKRDFVDERDSSVVSVVKRVKSNEVEFKSKGNRKQFEHQQQVLDCLTDAQHSLANAKYEKAKRAIEEGITLTEKRIKVIKLADRSEFGWSTVSEYLSDELASNSEDEKRIFRSERRAERRSKLAVRRRKISARGTRSSSNSAHSSPARSASTSGLLLSDPASRIGPCYKLSIHSHLLSFYSCSLVFSFALPAYFSALFTSRSAGYRGTLHYSPYGCCISLFLWYGK